MNPRRKKEKRKTTLKYKGVKNSEIKKYTSCEDDGDSKVCTAEDGTKEKGSKPLQFLVRLEPL